MKNKLDAIEKTYLYFFWICFIMVNPPMINFFNEPVLVGGILPKLWVWVYSWYFLALIGFAVIGRKWVKYIKD